MIYIYDVEIYPNLFVVVFKPLGKREHKVFIIWQDEKGHYLLDDRPELIKFLKSDIKLIGYNNLNFDAPVLEYILMNPNSTVASIKDYANQCIDSRWAMVPEWKLSTKQLDPYKIWHFDNNARRTSLKWLEFMFQMKSIKDLPYDHEKFITLQSQVDKIVTYCKHDLKPTEILFEKSKPKILQRQKIHSKLGIKVINKSDASMGEAILASIISNKLQIPLRDLKNLRTNRSHIAVADCIFDYYWWLPFTKQVKEEYFDQVFLRSTVDSETGNKVFDLKAVPTVTYHWKDIEIVYGMGGIHGCVPKGVYESTDDMVIMSCDVAGEYPNMAIVNKIYPEHLGPGYVDIYRDHVVYERKRWPKHTHLMENLMYKLAANSAYGKYNSQHSFLYDPLCMVKTTVNGQLSKTMLAEMLMAIPGAKLLMLNTDGLEIMIPRKYVILYKFLCKKWEEITNLELEHDEYQKLVIDSVNHYIGIFSNGKVKRKGSFYIWDDYVKYEEYHKNASATIIPEAIFEYFHKGTSPEDTVNNCEDMFKFCYGVKKQSNFKHAIIIADEKRRISIKKNGDRVLRYYMSTGPKAGSLYKLWNDGRITALQKDGLIEPLQFMQSTEPKKYPNIDKNWYIDEAYKIINNIEGLEQL